MSQEVFVIKHCEKKVFQVILLFAVSFFLSSCISTHKTDPSSGLTNPDLPKQYDILRFQVNGASPEGFLGPDLILSVLEKKAPFINTHEVSQAPSSGVYCRVDILPRTPGKAASFFGFVSLFSLGAIPSWSVEEGYDIHYLLYVDGRFRGNFEYRIKRKRGLWLGLVPFIWLNLLTRDEEDAVEGSVLDFLVQSDPVFYSVEKNRIGDTPEF